MSLLARLALAIAWLFVGPLLKRTPAYRFVARKLGLREGC